MRRLELQMLAGGWAVEQIVAVLAGQPWVQSMRANILGWLGADVLRAEAWRAEQNAPAVGGNTSLWTPRAYKPGTKRAGHTGSRPAAMQTLAEALARRSSDPTFDLDEAVAIAVADTTDPDALEADLRQAIADACARWAAQRSAAATGGQQPPKEPGGAASVADNNADGDEPPAESTTKGRKRRGPPAGATVLAPSEEQLGQWLKAPKRAAQRSGASDDSETVRLSAPVRLGGV